MSETSENTFERLEKKIIINKSDAPLLQNRLSEYMQPDKFNVGGNPYVICNLYFDDDCDDVIRVSVERPMYKEKLRMRSYGTPGPDTQVFLELKKKFNGVGTKRRTKLRLCDAEKFLETRERPEGLSYIDTQVLNEISYYLSHHPVYPRVYVSYLRNAYFAKDDDSFRVTFDFDVLTRRDDLKLEYGRYGDMLFPPDKMLMEVKFSGSVPVWFAHIMSEFGLSFNPFSKYGTEYRKHIKNEIYSRCERRGG